ncbi:ATP-binding cassette domain-containing protein [Methylomonas rhizoryzae]|uniref:ATP-binding cassette domain-containing protein n=1 Tax=Methylomonas rhizoryzae TaxID=2608981 RepID=UPI0012325F4E|nr:ATP-binding cassette domain-containing protein [Methylomonas rhizoryzae]
MQLEVNVKLRRGYFELAAELNVQASGAGLYGEAGAGKSTLLEIIAGTLQPQSGYILLDGVALFDSRHGIAMPAAARPIGAVLQAAYRGSGQTVREVLHSVGRYWAWRRRWFSVEFLLRLLELSHLLDQRVGQLSGEQRQRVALAYALLQSPKLLLLDDIFATLPESCRQQVLPLLKRLQYEFGIPVIYASQSMSELLCLSDTLLIMEHGRIAQSGPIRELAKRQQVLRFLGVRQTDNIVTVKMQCHEELGGCSFAGFGGYALALPYRPQLEPGTKVDIAIRANDIALSHHYIQGISIQNQIKGRVCAVIARGDSVIVQIDCGIILLAEITPAANRGMGLREGDWVYCLIKTHAIVLLHELDFIPYQRVVNHDDGVYYLSPTADFQQ